MANRIQIMLRVFGIKQKVTKRHNSQSVHAAGVSIRMLSKPGLA